jgi:hypothetical protein
MLIPPELTPFILLFLFQRLLERISRGRLAGIAILFLDVSYGSNDLGKTKALAFLRGLCPQSGKVFLTQLLEQQAF